MSTDKLYIPKTITVGYNERNDTYTKKLAYVIYTDDKGVLRKETSWNQWRDKSLGEHSFNNEPTSGFVLNKGVGGNKWNHYYRSEHIRVYDPRDFEFEISISNLLFILQECSSIKGKGLDGEFVYSWDGKDLYLLPVSCKEYKDSLKHTSNQSIKFDKSLLKEGHTYLLKDGKEVIYLGRYFHSSLQDKKHIFHCKRYNYNYFEPFDIAKIAEVINQLISVDYIDLLDKYKKSDCYIGNLVSVDFVPLDLTQFFNKSIAAFEKVGDEYRLIKSDINFYYSQDYKNYYSRTSDDKNVAIKYSEKTFVPQIKNEKITLPPCNLKQELTIRDIKKRNLYSLQVKNDSGKIITI